MKSANTPPILWILILMTVAGCDDQATRIAREAADRQAQQNTAMANLQKEVATGVHQLVASDAQARSKLVDVHRDLQAERQRLDDGWKELESERQQLAKSRRTESLIAPIMAVAGGALLAVVVIGFCWYALFAAGSAHIDPAINEILITEVIANSPHMEGLHRAETTDHALISN